MRRLIGLRNGRYTNLRHAIERLPEEVVDTYATSVGLSLREREILGFLLEEKSAQEISELLFISVGTVKSHTHNIYQKAGVGNRMQLLQKIKYL